MSMLNKALIGSKGLVWQSVRVGKQDVRTFWVSANVTAVTKFKFKAGKSYYRRSDGERVGGTSLATVLNGGVVLDQSEQLAECRARVRMQVAIRDTARRLRQKLPYEHPGLSRIAELMVEVDALIDSGGVQ